MTAKGVENAPPQKEREGDNERKSQSDFDIVAIGLVNLRFIN